MRDCEKKFSICTRIREIDEEQVSISLRKEKDSTVHHAHSYGYGKTATLIIQETGLPKTGNWSSDSRVDYKLYLVADYLPKERQVVW
jgi:hypothetical protein